MKDQLVKLAPESDDWVPSGEYCTEGTVRYAAVVLKALWIASRIFLEAKRAVSTASHV